MSYEMDKDQIVLNELLEKPELRTLFRLAEYNWYIGWENDIKRIDERLRHVPAEQGGTEGGYLQKVLTDILKDMDIPEMRRELTLHNLKWLGRNLAFKNRDNPSFPSAIDFINHLLRAEGEEPLTIGG